MLASLKLQNGYAVRTRMVYMRIRHTNTYGVYVGKRTEGAVVVQVVYRVENGGTWMVYERMRKSMPRRTELDGIRGFLKNWYESENVWVKALDLSKVRGY